MFLALTTLVTRFSVLREARRPAVPVTGDAPRRTRAPSRCFEVLIPYLDAEDARKKGQPSDTRHALVVNVWAPGVTEALVCARERFQDHRRTHRSARMATEGPVALRIAREVEEAGAV